MKVEFNHGLGDCTYFAHQMPLYVRRGHEFTIACNPDKAFLFQASGVATTTCRDGAAHVAWRHGADLDQATSQAPWLVNKAAVNLGLAPMPAIGEPAELWREFTEVRLDLRPYIATEDWRAAEAFCGTLPRPVVLLHTKGNSFQDTKSLPDSTALELYRHLLDELSGSLVLLDWDQRVPRLASGRVRHLTDDWERIGIPRLLALIHQADLVMGVDSGPLHVTRFTDTPAVGMFPNEKHHPALYCLPRGRQVNVVPRDSCHRFNKPVRIAYNIVESPGGALDPRLLAKVAGQMLAAPRYLDDSQRGADVQLQQFVLDWERGNGNALSDYVDRHHSYDLLFKLIRQRFRDPQIVETGCVRCDEDWRGAGFSTYLFAAFLHRFGGKLTSIDNDAGHLAFAATKTGETHCVEYRCADSVEALAHIGRPIDVLLLDSLDSFVDGSAEHALAEVQAALPWLGARSLIVFDDTVYRARRFHGKGALAVGWLLEHGWRILYSGYQTLLERDGTG